MKTINLSVFIGLAALASGCAEKDTTQTSYWTEKSGVVVVHHINGKVDNVEKLSEKQLTAAEISAHGLTKGQKYFEVMGSHVVTPAKAPKTANATPKKDANKDGADKKLDAVTRQLTDLKSQISTLAADHKRLQEQIDAAKANAEPSPTPTEDTPRISQ